jgi:spore coat polysaccharide biosynthesis protein SpsF
LARPVDYACEQGLPIGAAVELVTRDAVRRAHDSASSVEDREHVTTFIKASAHEFDVAWLDAPPALTWPELRLTVDTADDLQYLQRVFAATGSAEPSLLHIIDAARRVPREAAA